MLSSARTPRRCWTRRSSRRHKFELLVYVVKQNVGESGERLPSLSESQSEYFVVISSSPSSLPPGSRRPPGSEGKDRRLVDRTPLLEMQLCTPESTCLARRCERFLGPGAGVRVCLHRDARPLITKAGPICHEYK